jgi:hypothetical protein
LPGGVAVVPRAQAFDPSDLSHTEGSTEPMRNTLEIILTLTLTLTYTLAESVARRVCTHTKQKVEKQA